ncbi:MAG: helix-turn-helix transcriptional regulator [Rickettsiales bacterium]|nr:helix-turn-helix transcriptional regulator [Rickettsiales bacterium]
MNSKILEIRESISNNLKELRLSKGLSQKDAGNVLSISPQQYQKYEKGQDRMSADSLIHLLNELDVDVSVFMNEVYKNCNNNDKKESSDLELIGLFSNISKENKEFLLTMMKIMSGK